MNSDDQAGRRRVGWIIHLPWFGPAVMTVTMLILLTLLIWRLQTHHLEQNHLELSRALESARDSISARLEADEGFLKVLTEQLASGTLIASEFEHLAENYLAERPRLTAIYFIKADHTVLWIVPEEYKNEAQEISQTISEHVTAINQTNETGALTYSRPHVGLSGTQCFDLYVPTPEGSRLTGIMVASYNSRSLLRNTMDRSTIQAYQTELCGGAGQIIYSTPKVAQVDNRLVNEITLLRPDNGLKLRLSKYRAPFWDQQTVALMTICIALIGGMGLGMWALSKQIAERVSAEKALQDANAELEHRVLERTNELSIINHRLAREIAERLEIEEQSRRHMDQLAQMGRVSMMGEMAAGLAHELHQPLGAISSYIKGCQRILEQPSPDVKRIAYAVDNVNTQSRRAAEIIDRLRTFLTPKPPCKQPHNLRTLIDESEHLIEPDRKRIQIKLETDIPPNTPTVMVDRVQIQQVIINLLKNAFESVQARGSDDRLVSIGASLNGGPDIRVDVCDTGIGCSLEELQLIFEPFKSTKAENMGMGLPISRTIIEAHEGRLWATRNQDHGMTFSFTIKVVNHNGSV
ncbi:MAG: ATP-binding protein [Phycisphaerales bacterium]